MGTVFKIAGGIFFGVLMLWIFSAAVFSVAVNESAKSVQQVVQQSADRERRAADARRDQAWREQAQKQAAIDRQATERNRARIAELEKAQAWAAYWKPSAECLTTTSVECGNEHIRAQREFERRYSDGSL